MDITKELAMELLDTIKNTKEFVIEQSPDLIQQVYRYGVFENVALLIFGIISLVVFCSIIVNHEKIGKWSCDNDSVGFIVAGTMLALIAGVILTLGGIFTLAKLILAPKLYLIEYLSNLIK